MSENKSDIRWTKEQWHQIIEQSNDQFEALREIFRAMFQQAVDIAVIAVKEELTEDLNQAREVQKKQNQLLKQVINLHKSHENFTKQLAELDTKGQEITETTGAK